MELIIEVLYCQIDIPNYQKIELIGRKRFAIATLDPDYKAFVIHIVALNVSLNNKVQFSKKAQIVHLKADEASIKVPSKYVDLEDIFSPNLAMELLDNMDINNHTIELLDDQQPPYGPIYSLSSVE